MTQVYPFLMNMFSNWVFENHQKVAYQNCCFYGSVKWPIDIYIIYIYVFYDYTYNYIYVCVFTCRHRKKNALFPTICLECPGLSGVETKCFLGGIVSCFVHTVDWTSPWYEMILTVRPKVVNKPVKIQNTMDSFLNQPFEKAFTCPRKKIRCGTKTQATNQINSWYL